MLEHKRSRAKRYSNAEETHMGPFPLVHMALPDAALYQHSGGQ